MTCTAVQLPGGGHGVVCTRAAPTVHRACSVCGARAHYLCDGPPDGPAEAGTCDAPLCGHCSSVQPDGRDLCPHCRTMAESPGQGADAGRWNAFVEAGRDRAERARRLACCPPALRAEVEDHVETVFASRRRARERRRRSSAT
jgi:hypothetical protein